jgi:alkanesulfonate monooxygenase SsuD/methylene tetrahydromethanopterin reductase-like flavin-dependent oxidoreductase (luciferase family)
MTANDQAGSSSAQMFPDGRDRWPKGRRQMSLGLMVPISERHAFGDAAPRFRDMVEIVRTGEAVGFDVAWFADHLIVGQMPFQPIRGDAEPARPVASPAPPPPAAGVRGVWECWTTMAGIAAATERIHIGSLVVCTGFRNPGLLAKMAEMVDEIGDGRAILGLGAGWHKPEYDMFGYPYDRRVGRFEEAIAVIQPLLRHESATFQGDFEHVEGAVNIPAGPRASGVPILVGTDGPRMLRITARYADAWNTVWHKDPAAVVPLIAQTERICREVGRDPETLVKTAGGNIALTGYRGARPDPIEGDAAAIAERLRGFAAIGLSHFVCGLDPCTPRSVEEFGRVIELLGQ